MRCLQAKPRQRGTDRPPGTDRPHLLTLGAVQEKPPLQNEVGQQDRHGHDLRESSFISRPRETALAWSSVGFRVNRV